MKFPNLFSSKPAARTEPVFDEVATTEDGRDITLGYVDGLQLLPTTDPIQKARGFDLRVYAETRRDDQVQTALQQRKLALIGKEWNVLAGGNKRQDKAAADFITEQLGNIAFDRSNEKMLGTGLFYGHAAAECLWARDGRFIALSDIKVKNVRRFGFAPSGELRLLTSAQPMGEAVPERKFWAFSTGADDDDSPYGLGLAHWLYWPTFFKRNDIKFWLIFLEKFGMPTGVGKYPAGALQSEKERLLHALSAIQTDSGVIIPEGMTIELLEAARSGSADYTALYDRMNAAISKVILGHTGATDSTAGKLGGDDMASEVRSDLIAADADLICSSFNRSVVKWLCEWNFPGAALPKVWREVEEPEDLKSRADRDKVLFDMGYKPTLKYVTETYDGEFEVVEPPPPAPDTAAAVKPAEGQAAFAEAGGDLNTTVSGGTRTAPQKVQSGQGDNPAQQADIDPTPVSAQSELLSDDAGSAIKGMVDTIRAKVEKADSLEALSADLLNGYGDLDSAELAKVMALAFAAADLAGRFDVSEGS
jgi:phage gp29-like protein